MIIGALLLIAGVLIGINSSLEVETPKADIKPTHKVVEKRSSTKELPMPKIEKAPAQQRKVKPQKSETIAEDKEFFQDREVIAQDSIKKEQNPVKKERFYKDPKVIEQIIEDEGYQRVDEEDKPVQIYVKNLPQKEDESFIPPMMPSIITVTYPDKKRKSIVVKSSILQNNKKILVVEKDRDNNIKEAVEVPLKVDETKESSQQKKDKDITILTPPQIGK